MKRRGIAAVLSVTLTGCLSTNYTPRSSGHVATVMQDGQAGYLRDGQFYRHGILGGGLEDAVKGNPLAQEAASTYHSRNGWGFVLGLGGMVCAEVGLGMMLDGSNDPDYEPSRTLSTVTIGCAAVSLIGMIVLISAIPYQMDAINIFNDGVDVTHAAPPLPQRRPPLRPE